MSQVGIYLKLQKYLDPMCTCVLKCLNEMGDITLHIRGYYSGRYDQQTLPKC